MDKETAQPKETTPRTRTVRGKGLTAVSPGVHGLHERDCCECERAEGHGGEYDPVPAQAFQTSERVAFPVARQNAPLTMQKI